MYLRSKTLCLMLAATVFAGCSDDDENSAPPEPPALKLLGVRSALGSAQPQMSGCIDLGPDPNRTVFVRVDVENFDLKPPRSCDGASACGSVKVTLGADTFSVTGVTETIAVPFADRDEGNYQVSVTLVDDYGEDIEGECSPGPCKTSGSIRFERYCDGEPPPEPMLDAGVEDVEDAGAPDAGQPADPGSGAGPDGGALSDAGSAPLDAGQDAGRSPERDAGGGAKAADASADAGAPPDVGAPPDADSGLALDASVDAG